jgi:hypothetical protein
VISQEGHFRNTGREPGKLLAGEMRARLVAPRGEPELRADRQDCCLYLRQLGGVGRELALKAAVQDAMKTGSLATKAGKKGGGILCLEQPPPEIRKSYLRAWRGVGWILAHARDDMPQFSAMVALAACSAKGPLLRDPEYFGGYSKLDLCAGRASDAALRIRRAKLQHVLSG